MDAVNEALAPSSVKLNAFFSARGDGLVFLEQCPGCGTEIAATPYAKVRGHAASEGVGVQLPAVRCPACELVYLNPRLAEAAVSAFYNQSPRLLSYFTSGFKDTVDRGRGFIPFVELIGAASRGRKGELLDLGCGAGAFIRLMKERGFSVTGAELSEPVATFARREGLDVIAADAEKAIQRYRAEERQFDLITMIHAFEHLPHPSRVLRGVRTLLRDGGLVAINVPNLRYPLAHLDPIFGTDLGGIWDPVGHFNYFTLRSLSRLVEKAGFDVVARDSRFLAYGRSGFVGAIDNLVSVPCRWFGGLGSNIAVIGRTAPLA